MKKRTFIISILIFFIALITLYLCVIPAIFSNEKFVNNLLSSMKIKVESPELRTYLVPKISLNVKKIEIENALEVKNLDTEISFKVKKIIVNRLLAEYVFADVDKLSTLFPASKGESKKSKIQLDLYDSILGLKESKILYSLDKNTKFQISSSAFVDNTRKEFRPVHFDIDAKIIKPNKTLSVGIKDKNKVYIQNKSLNIKDCVFDINKSHVVINAYASRKKGINLNLSSKNFRIEDVYDIVDSNLIVANGHEMLAFFKDMSGNFDFDLNMTKKDMSGKVRLNKFSTKIIPVNNLPLTLTKGEAVIGKRDIYLKNIEGFYGKNPDNKLTSEGEIKDYTKSCASNIVIKTAVNDEFTKDYLSPIAGIPLKVVGKAGTRIIVRTLYDNIDIEWASRLAKGSDILVDGASLTPVGYDRAVNSLMHFKNNILDIEKIDYFIAETINKDSKIKPILSLHGKVDCNESVPVVRIFGFNIPRPLPSEFLNLFAGQKMFKGGTFYGDITYLNFHDLPKIKGNIHAEKIRIPSQKIFIKEGKFFTDKETIHAVANGRFKRSNFEFTGDVLNEMRLPIVIKNVEFSLDKVDVEKLMDSMTQTQTPAPAPAKDDEEDGAVDFDISNLIVEKCVFKLKEGKYKDIDFGNLNANLTLDKNSVLEIKARKFNIAEGISSLKVLCDLKKQKYELKLGVKDVDSEKMSAALLNITREISGKASGFIELNTDSTGKLNGLVKFNVKDGTIQKMGLIEYLLKFVALFRNPLVMISPSTIGDIVNIPEGKFNSINGELYIKNNCIELLKIKSASPQLSAYIVGCYNLENSDAILRIYTKFSNKNKGFGGFLRNISLNSLANRIPLSSRSDEHYYSSELANLPPIEADEKDCQIFLTKVDGDIEHNNFISSLKKIK